MSYRGFNLIRFLMLNLHWCLFGIFVFECLLKLVELIVLILAQLFLQLPLLLIQLFLHHLIVLFQGVIGILLLDFLLDRHLVSEVHVHVFPGGRSHPCQRHVELGFQQIEGFRSLLQGLPVVHRLNPSCFLGNGSILLLILIRLIVLLIFLDLVTFLILLVLLQLLEDSFFVLPQVLREVLRLEMLRI
jgi:hypothetical protein